MLFLVSASVDGTTEPGPKTKDLWTQIIFGGGSMHWSKKYQKNNIKLKLKKSPFLKNSFNNNEYQLTVLK